MKELLDSIHNGKVIVADGAIGTMLLQAGCDIKECPEEINLSRPDILKDIARQYLAAGAEIVQTNTFGASPLRLARSGLDDRTEEINRRAVDAVRAAVDTRAFVSGSVGPSGTILIPYGDTEPQTVFNGFLRQAEALVAAGVDLICVETMTDINEAVLAVKAARAVAPNLPIMATMTFDLTPKGFFTIMGVNIDKAASELHKAGADLVGSNCGHGMDMMVKIAREFRIRSRCPIVIQSNAGLPDIVDGRPVYNESPEFMAEKVPDLVAADVSVIGGCCGTTPDHIAAIRRAVDALPR